MIKSKDVQKFAQDHPSHKGKSQNSNWCPAHFYHTDLPADKSQVSSPSFNLASQNHLWHPCEGFLSGLFVSDCKS